MPLETCSIISKLSRISSVVGTTTSFDQIGVDPIEQQSTIFFAKETMEDARKLRLNARENRTLTSGRATEPSRIPLPAQLSSEAASNSEESNPIQPYTSSIAAETRNLFDEATWNLYSSRVSSSLERTPRPYQSNTVPPTQTPRPSLLAFGFGGVTAEERFKHPS